MNDEFNFSPSEQARELLEDFAIIATGFHAALIPRKQWASTFGTNIRTAVIASSLRLKGLDYVRQNYVDDVSEPAADPDQAYITAYMLAKKYIQRALDRFDKTVELEPSVGVFGASLVLERLPASFFCAHLLYRMGHKFEGHAVARLILEQIAWAYAAHQLDDVPSIKKIEATRAISALKALIPDAGKLYGFLSQKTHIDYSSHREILRIEDGRNIVMHTTHDYEEYAGVIMTLADYFVVVWEISQFQYLSSHVAIAPSPDGSEMQIVEQRDFLLEITQALEQIRVLEQTNGEA